MDAANALAYIALFGWIPLTLLLFARLRPAVAVCVSLLGAHLLLPVGLKFEYQGLPDIAREELACLSILLGLLVFRPRALRFWRHAGWADLLVALLVIGPFATSVVNGDALAYGPRVLPGQGLYNGVSGAFVNALVICVPFLLGRELVRRPEELRRVLVLFVGFMLAYSLLVLWEARMSPNLHRIFYGYHPHSFLQHIRFGGWRPVVFAAHGLDLSLAVASAALAAFCLGRARRRVGRIPGRTAGFYLMFVLLACRSLASLVYGAALAPLVALTRPRMQVRIAVAAAALVLLYPMLRMTETFPTRRLVGIVTGISEKRAASLAFRFDHDEQLLTKARERLLMGWGSWGRYRIYDERTGEDVSVSDGFWIIQLGSAGLVGFGAFFLLQLSPIFATSRRFRRIRSERDRILFAGVSMIVAMRAIDLLPNASVSSFAFFLAGGLDGAVRAWRPSRRRVASAAPAPVPAPASAPADPGVEAESGPRVPGFG